jgi:prepilin-type processing-associated H-X9-DG protein
MAQLKSTSVTGDLSVTGNILASVIKKLGGSSSQILMADGSVKVIGDLITDTDTTYTFGGGTNGFTVTPKGGTA